MTDDQKCPTCDKSGTARCVDEDGLPCNDHAARWGLGTRRVKVTRAPLKYTFSIRKPADQ
jgi:hypothetical protein